MWRKRQIRKKYWISVLVPKSAWYGAQRVINVASSFTLTLWLSHWPRGFSQGRAVNLGYKIPNPYNLELSDSVWISNFRLEFSLIFGTFQNSLEFSRYFRIFSRKEALAFYHHLGMFQFGTHSNVHMYRKIGRNEHCRASVTAKSACCWSSVIRVHGVTLWRKSPSF